MRDPTAIQCADFFDLKATDCCGSCHGSTSGHEMRRIAGPGGRAAEVCCTQAGVAAKLGESEWRQAEEMRERRARP